MAGDRAPDRGALSVRVRLNAGHDREGVALPVVEEGHPFLDSGLAIGVDEVRSALESYVARRRVAPRLDRYAPNSLLATYDSPVDGVKLILRVEALAIFVAGRIGR